MCYRRKEVLKNIVSFIPTVFLVMTLVALVLYLLPQGKLKKDYDWTREHQAGDCQRGIRSTPVPSVQLVFDLLRKVIDPELDVNIVDMGLVYDVAVTGEEIALVMTLTFPGCPYGPELIGKVKEALFSNPAIQHVHLHLTFEPPWTVTRMKSGLGERLLGVQSTYAANHHLGEP